MYETNLTKAEEIHQTHKPTGLITANVPRPVYLFYFLPAELYIHIETKICKKRLSIQYI